jgi:hypothetical protein
MTQPTRPPHDRQFARDVAKQLDRRQTRRRLTLWSALLALVAAGAAYLRCGGGHGFGLGLGGGQGGDERPVTAPARCAIRVSARGITVGGRAMSRDQAVASCKATTGADVVVTGDAREGDWRDLEAALRAAEVKDIAVHTAPSPSRAPGSRPDGEPPHR